jgi:hypothetical protein
MKAKNCAVLGDGSQKGDHAHVTKSTPFDLKRREFQDSEQYTTKLAPDIDRRRETAVTRARRNKGVRPLGGS